MRGGTYLTEKYFDEQLERIREIRASERKFYQKITDLYATAIDYDKNSATTRRFYATVQNMLHEAEAHHISVILTKSISRFGNHSWHRHSYQIHLLDDRKLCKYGLSAQSSACRVEILWRLRHHW